MEIQRPTNRVLSTAIIVLLLLPSLSAQDIKQQIRQSSRYIYEIVPNQQLTGYLVSETWHDRNGHIIEEKEYLPDGQLLSWEIHEWQDDLMMISHHFAEGNEPTASTLYSYDESKRLVGIRKTDSSGVLNLETRYIYNPGGQVTEFMRFNADSSTFAHTSYSYDAKGQLVASKWHDKEGTVRTVFEYGKNARLPETAIDTLTGTGMYTRYLVGKHKIKVLRKQNGGKLYLSGLIILDKQQAISQKISFGSDGKKTGQWQPDENILPRTQYVQDESGLPLEILHFEGDRLVRIEKFIYSWYE